MQYNDKNGLFNSFLLVLKVILLTFISICVGGGLLTLVFMLPSNRLRDNVGNSLSVYVANPIEAWNKDYWNYTQTDMQTESIKIMEAISNEEGTPFARAMNCTYYNWDGQSPMDSLVKYVTGETGQNKISYARYWHGYLVIIKPLLFMFSLSTIKIINMTLQFIICICMIILINDKIGVVYSFAYAGAILVLNPVKIFLSMQNDIVFYIASIASIIILLYNNRIKKDMYIYLFLFNGISVAYFDLLTYPVASLGIPLIIYILLNVKNLRTYITDIIRLSFAWGFGYGGMWIGKWFLSDLILKTNVIQDGIRNLIYRASGDPFAEVGEVDSSYLHTVLKNCAVLHIVTIEMFIFVFIIIMIYQHCRNKTSPDYHRIVAISAISIYPFIWYYVVRNHSVIHPWIEYQEMSVFVFGLLSLFGMIVTEPKRDIGT